MSKQANIYDSNIMDNMVAHSATYYSYVTFLSSERDISKTYTFRNIYSATPLDYTDELFFMLTKLFNNNRYFSSPLVRNELISDFVDSSCKYLYVKCKEKVSYDTSIVSDNLVIFPTENSPYKVLIMNFDDISKICSIIIYRR